MIAARTALKRKIEDELPGESGNPSKIRKVEQIQNANKGTQSTSEIDSSVVFNSGENNNTTKIRRKLSSILHFQKKYKYYCKKHNVVYLIEKTRMKSRELSKQSRDHLVNSFRSLDVAGNVSVNPQQLLESMEVDFYDDGKDSFDQSESDSTITECKISRIYVISDENETENSLAQREQNIPWNKQSANKISINQIIHNYILCDESEDSDSNSDEGYTEDEDYYESSNDETFTLTRSPGGTSVLMKKINDSSDVNYYDDFCTHHNCALQHYFKHKSYDYDSFDED